MTTAFKLPDLGEGVHEGEILQIFVSEGDDVKEGNPILEVETDKAAVEIPSPYTGKVKKILVKIGDTVQVGDEMILFEVEGKPERVREEFPRVAPAPPQMPAVAVEAVEKKAEGAPAPERPAELPVAAAPSTRRLARELGVDLRKVTPSGPGGRVTEEDVRSFAEGKKPEKKEEVPERRERPARAPAVAAPALPDFSKWGPVERVAVRSIRRATARQMALAWSQIPHVNSLGEVDITLLDAFIKKHKPAVEAKGGRLTLTVFALKAVAAALRAYPRFNATLDIGAEEMILKRYYNVGVAVDTPDGLIVPVVRDVDRKSILELSVELKDLVERTRNRKASLDEMKGGTFTITNVGPMGGGYFAPIINYPEVAILGLGSARWQPVVKEKAEQRREIVPRLIMPTVLGIDHRILDGADALKFMRFFSDVLEDPENMLMRIS